MKQAHANCGHLAPVLNEGTEVEDVPVCCGLCEAINDLNNKPCTCTLCDFCGGNGTYRIDCHGNRTEGIDDLYELENCDQCNGGVVEDCERCIELRELGQQVEELENR